MKISMRIRGYPSDKGVFLSMTGSLKSWYSHGLYKKISNNKNDRELTFIYKL